jgi:Papain family cysteine protease
MKANRACIIWMANAVLAFPLFGAAQNPTNPQPRQLGNIKVLSVPAPRELEARLAKKPQFNVELLQKALTYREQLPVLKLKDGKQVTLVPLDEKVAPPPGEGATIGVLPNAFIKYQQPAYKINPNILKYLYGLLHVNHGVCQTPIRDQGGRGTCTAFASVAGIESWEKCHKSVDLNLSEQHAYEITLQQVGSTCSQDAGTVTYYTAKYLTDHHICTEADWAYQMNLAGCTDTIPQKCSNDTRYGFTDTQIILGTAFGGVAGQSANDTDYLENFLYNGYDIVYGLYVAGNEWNNGTAETGVVDVQQQNGGPAPAYGGHAMLLVGYNKVDRYFIFKNSWNTSHGHAGYFYLSYDYITTYGKYGYVVKGIAD